MAICSLVPFYIANIPNTQSTSLEITALMLAELFNVSALVLT